jgi:hypothetical protein
VQCSAVQWGLAVGARLHRLRGAAGASGDGILRALYSGYLLCLVDLVGVAMTAVSPRLQVVSERKLNDDCSVYPSDAMAPMSRPRSISPGTAEREHRFNAMLQVEPR